MKYNFIDIEKFNRMLRQQMGKRYKFGAEIEVGRKAIDAATEWDCSEILQVHFNMFGSSLPDGSQNQFDYCLPVDKPCVGDLGFSGSGPKGINHVFILISGRWVLEARGKPYNRVILRPRAKWEAWRGFQGWRRVPDVKFYWPVTRRPVRDYPGGLD